MKSISPILLHLPPFVKLIIPIIIIGIIWCVMAQLTDYYWHDSKKGRDMC